MYISSDVGVQSVRMTSTKVQHPSEFYGEIELSTKDLCVVKTLRDLA